MQREWVVVAGGIGGIDRSQAIDVDSDVARARVVKLGCLCDIELDSEEIVTRRSRIVEGVIGKAKVSTNTAVWECLVLCNEEGHAFSTLIALGDYLEGEGCVERDNGTRIVEKSYGLFGNYTSGAWIEIRACIRVWGECHGLLIIQGWCSSRISLTAGYDGDVEIREEVVRICIEVEVVRHGHGHTTMCQR